jgi:probable F420-dependent oxidoreductase
MPVPQRIAVTLPDERGVHETVELAKWAESAGFDDIWFADNSGIDSLTLAASVSMITERVRIGTAIIPVFTRTPAVLASTTHVLNQVSGGRFILGLGSSSEFMMVNWNGQVFEKPRTRVKETIQLVKSMLAGEKSDFDGETVSSHGYKQPPLDYQPVYMAALREKMLETAAEVADGVIINLFPRSALPKIMKHIRIGAERAGKNLEDMEIVCRHQVVVTDDPDGARDTFRARYAPYYATPVYNKFLAWAGFEDAAATIEAGWAARDRTKTTSALVDGLVDEIAAIGSEDAVQERIREYADLGITTHIISCCSEADLQRTYEAFSADQFAF